MADYKMVVEMLGETVTQNLASLLELAKKLLVDWAIEPKKLLHVFQNIRKDDLLGLVSGTHEIKPKEKQTQLTSGDDEYFEQILVTDYITIPHITTVVAYTKDKWSKEIGSVTPSTVLETSTKKRVLIYRLKKNRSSQQCVDFAKTIPGATLPNVFGLAVAEMIVGPQLPRDKWILGFDNRDNLSVSAHGDLRVSRLCLSSGGGVDRDWLRWAGDWVDGVCLVLLCD